LIEGQIALLHQPMEHTGIEGFRDSADRPGNLQLVAKLLIDKPDPRFVPCSPIHCLLSLEVV
jgi:hypothetical protein